MKAFDTLDATRLFGFASLGDRLANGVDFRNEIIDGKLGAKVGVGETWAPCELLNTEKTEPAGKIDFAKLLGFEGVSEQLSSGVDFQNETMDARLGARVGAEESMF
jgi:hypothetical protein